MVRSSNYTLKHYAVHAHSVSQPRLKIQKANAICERVHQILGMMMRTSEIDMANSVEPAYIDTSIDNTAWAFC